jgi:hypothetical protein
MMKPLLVAALAIVGLSFSADNAQAGRRCCRARCCCATACNTCNSCSTGCNAGGCNAINPNGYNQGPMTDPNVAPPPPQGTNATAYQSYSYEPAATVTMNSGMAGTSYYAPQTDQRSMGAYAFRGDRKALGKVAQ